MDMRAEHLEKPVALRAPRVPVIRDADAAVLELSAARLDAPAEGDSMLSILREHIVGDRQGTRQGRRSESRARSGKRRVTVDAIDVGSHRRFAQLERAA